MLSTQLISIPGLSGAPFIMSGLLKLIYDLILYRSFKTIKPQEEQNTA